IVPSSPSCPQRLNQMAPGLIVPVVWLAQPWLRQVFIGVSTTGIMWSNGCPIPTSLTKDCRYGRLYWKVKPQLRVSGAEGFVVMLGEMAPVMAKGRRYSRDEGRSPKPFPKKTAGEMVENESEM